MGYFGRRMTSQAQLIISPADAPRLVSWGYISRPPGREKGSSWSTVTPSIISWLSRVFPRPEIHQVFVNDTSSVSAAAADASAIAIMLSVWAIRLICHFSKTS